MKVESTQEERKISKVCVIYRVIGKERVENIRKVLVKRIEKV